MHDPDTPGTWRLVRFPSGAGDGTTAAESIPFPGRPGDALPGAILALGDTPHTHLMTGPASGGDPSHAAALLKEAAADPDAMVIGCGTEVRRLTASLERLCLRLETGVYLADPHSPYRVIPLAPLRRLATKRPAPLRDVELITHLAWGRVPVRPVSRPGLAGSPAIAPWAGLVRHAGLLLRRLLPWPYPAWNDRAADRPMDLWHPFRFLRQVLAEHASPRDLALAAFVGVFMGALPLLACHMVAILYVTTRYRLNRAMALATQNLCMPPVVPVLCVEVGHFLRHGEWLTEVSRQTVLRELHLRLWEWLIGSVPVGLVLGGLTGLIVYGAARKMEGWAARDRAPARINDRRRGNRLGYWSFDVALRLFGRRGAYGLLRGVAFHYLVFDPIARRSAWPYLSHRFPERTGLRRVLDTYRLLYSQGVSLIDRYRMMRRPDDFTRTIEGYDAVAPLVADRSRGFVLLVSHVGNWQAVMLALKRMGRPLTLLMRPEENPVANRYLKFQEPTETFRFISPDTPLGGVIELTQRFQAGDIIAVMGDRAYGSSTLPVDFLGAPAQFPVGPFQLAAAWECPVVVLFSARTGDDEYTVAMADVLRVESAGPRRERVKSAMQAYAHRLQEYARRHPYQVYLFEDAWRKE